MGVFILNINQIDKTAPTNEIYQRDLNVGR